MWDMEKVTFSAKEGWLRIKFVLTVEDGKVKDVEYSASRCKTLRSVAEAVAGALKGVRVEEVKERVKEVLSGISLPENRENRRLLILRAFGLDG